MLAAALALCFSACQEYKFSVDYVAPIRISFTGVDNSNIITLAKGVTNYDAEIVINSDCGLVQAAWYEADNRTGAAGAQIGTQDYYSAEKTATINYSFTGLTKNACIRVTASDVEGHSVSKNLVVSLTPAVDISDQSYFIETAEVYYGVYYATWLGGRVYLRSTDGIEKYKDNIAVAFGEVGTPTTAATLMSPALRKSTFGLPNLEGLHATKVGETTMTKAQYDAINKVDASPIEAIADPTDDSVEVAAGKVYVFKRDDGLKGLIYVESSAAKTATVENAAGEWEKDTPYHLLKISSKSIAK